MRNYLYILFFLIFPGGLLAQQPDEIINRYGSQNPIEKIYLQLDRDNYIAGETIWFKAYHYADFLPGKNTTTIFIELLDPSSGLIEQRTAPVFAGTAHGQFELPATLPGGIYFLRAYSPTMLNYDAEFAYIRRVFISGKKAGTVTTQKTASTRIEFFPEGGNFVTGLSNTIAYKATSETGLPVTVSGLVKNEAGETVAEFSSYHDGMGFFDLLPKERDTYYAILNGDPAAKKYMLPPQSAKGVVLRLISSGKTKSFEILQHTGDPAFEVAYMIGQMQHNTAFKTSSLEKKNRLTGNIQTDDFPSGILHVTAFNKDGIPLAERLTFVNNREYIQEGELTVDTLDFSEKGKNVFTLSLKDTVQGSFSMAVTDAAFEYLPRRTENILSGLLITGDIRGYVHDPAYYFSSDTDTVANALDLVMMTNGWRRFKWTTIINNLPAAAPVYKDPGYITLTGKVNLEGTRKPFADKELLTLIITADSSRTMQMIRTNAKGQYRLDSLIFFDKANIFINDPKRKGRKFIDVFGEEQLLNKPYVLPRINTSNYPLPATIYTTAKQKLLDNEYDAITKANGLLLTGITVQSRPKTKQEEFEEKNVSALFTGGEIRSLSLLGKPTVGYANILDYLQARLPGLEVRKENYGAYSVYMRLNSSFTSNPVPTIFLDEALSDVSMLATIPAEQIALVKMYSHFVGAPGGGIGGVLAVYTKKAADLKMDIPSTGDVLKYKGYSVLKEFYSPDYSVDTLKNADDKRITLLWNPDIWVSDINPKIPVSFYNSDRARQFKIVVEGMSSTGKMLFIEKTVIANNNGKAF